MKARNAFLAATALALGLPLLGWTGLRGFVGVHGFDTPDVKPVPSVRNVLSGRFRRDFETHWGHVFFGRTEMLFAKNGLYEAFNLGQYHSGFAGRIVQGKRGQIFEKPYVDVAVAESLPIFDPILQRRTRTALRQFSETVSSLGRAAPTVAFLLAPSKAETFGSFLPDRYGRLRRTGGELPQPWAVWHGLLEDVGIPYFDAAAENRSGAEFGAVDLFPYTGTHWTVDWAARAVSNVLAVAAPSLPRPAPMEPRIVSREPFTRDDRDLAGLLNLPIPYRRWPDVYAHPVFGPPAEAAGGGGGASADRPRRILLFGDSFSVQVRDALVLSGAYRPEDVTMWFNETPAAAEFRKAAHAADLILFTYSAPSLASSRVATTATILANHMRPLLKPGRKYALGRSPYLGSGDWGEDDGGRVATLAPGARGSLELHVPVLRHGGTPELRLHPAGNPPTRDVPFTVQCGPDRAFDVRLRAGQTGPVQIPLETVPVRGGLAVRDPSLSVPADAPEPLRLSAIELVF